MPKVETKTRLQISGRLDLQRFRTKDENLINVWSLCADVSSDSFLLSDVANGAVKRYSYSRDQLTTVYRCREGHWPRDIMLVRTAANEEYLLLLEWCKQLEPYRNQLVVALANRGLFAEKQRFYLRFTPETNDGANVTKIAKTSDQKLIIGIDSADEVDVYRASATSVELVNNFKFDIRYFCFEIYEAHGAEFLVLSDWRHTCLTTYKIVDTGNSIQFSRLLTAPISQIRRLLFFDGNLFAGSYNEADMGHAICGVSKERLNNNEIVLSSKFYFNAGIFIQCWNVVNNNIMIFDYNSSQILEIR